MAYNVFFPNWFQISALLSCKIKVVLHRKGATKTEYGNRGFCKSKTPF